jgi:putative Ca2+/H+ antiporter (TMEM165/GDT1 family)
MAPATTFHWKKVFLGVAFAFVLLNLGAVLVGKAAKTRKLKIKTDTGKW